MLILVVQAWHNVSVGQLGSENIRAREQYKATIPKVGTFETSGSGLNVIETIQEVYLVHVHNYNGHKLQK